VNFVAVTPSYTTEPTPKNPANVTDARVAAAAKARARLAELRQDPEWMAAYSRRMKEAQKAKPRSTSKKKMFANFAGADLSGCDLTGLDLSGADLSKCNLSGADLSDTNLRGANLTGARLTGARLTGASLAGAVLTGVQF
jgi:uncharacterized protein YjbI with pentapeptide repeats